MAVGSKQDRTKSALIAGIILATIFAAAFISWGLWQSAEYEREANDQAGKYAAYTDQKIRQSCLRMTPTYKQGCAAKARHEQRDYERNERDLVAQRQSALWAYIMGAAAVIGMGLSVIGIFLVWTTFAETRKANAIANDALDGQLRPWLDFTVMLRAIAFEGNSLKSRIRINFAHHGTSPAIDVMFAVRTFVGEFWPSERLYNHVPLVFDDDEVVDGRRTVFPGEDWSETKEIVLSDLPNEGVPAAVLVVARYRSPYSSENRYTCKVFDFIHRDGPDRLLHFGNRAQQGGVTMKPRNERGDYAN